MEGDFDFLPVKVTREIEEKGFEQLLGRIELRADADIGRALQFLTRGEDSPGHGIDAVFRAEVSLDREIGGRIADGPPALVAMLDHAANGERAGHQARGHLRIACLQCLADAAGRNEFAAIPDRTHRARLDPMLRPDLAQQLDIAAARLAEGEILTRHDPCNTKPFG